jgi:hypothetical protein
MVWRFEKSELGMQSPHLETRQAREKLLLIARLSYAFLTSLARFQLRAIAALALAAL